MFGRDKIVCGGHCNVTVDRGVQARTRGTIVGAGPLAEVTTSN